MSEDAQPAPSRLLRALAWFDDGRIIRLVFYVLLGGAAITLWLDYQGLRQVPDYVPGVTGPAVLPAVGRPEVDPAAPNFSPTAPLKVAASRSHRDARTQGVLDRMGPIEELALGSSLKFCRIAEGGLDVYPRFGPTSEWDTAAAQCVLHSAGGALLSADTGKPFRYNRRESLLNGDFVALGDPDLPWRDWL